jgi:phage/plasmid-associated DNA primase
MNSASIVMRTNNFPGLDPDSPAIWNRVRLVEFPNSFAGREDKTLPEQLDAEAVGILARLVRHAIGYYERGGLQPNLHGDARLVEIKASVDYIGDVLERRFEKVPDGATPKAEVKAIIEDECRRAGVPNPTASRGFDERMARKGFPPSNKKINSVTTRVYLGLVPRGGEGSDLLSKL